MKDERIENLPDAVVTANPPDAVLIAPAHLATPSPQLSASWLFIPDVSLHHAGDAGDDRAGDVSGHVQGFERGQSSDCLLDEHHRASPDDVEIISGRRW